MYSRIIVAPPVEPITLAEAKIDRALDHDLHDDLLSSLISSAREWVEEYCSTSLVTQTRESSVDGFSPIIEIPYGPIQEIVSVSYVAIDGTDTPITDYVSDLYGIVGRLMPVYGSTWPTAQPTLNAIKVRYVAGYTPVAGSPTDYVSTIPAQFKTAIRLLVGNWYENRESTIVGTITADLRNGVDSLLWAYRKRLGMA